MAVTSSGLRDQLASQTKQQSLGAFALRALCGLGIAAGLFIASYCCWSSTSAKLHAPVEVVGDGDLYKLQQSVTLINSLDCSYHLIFGFGLAVFCLCSLSVINNRSG